MKLLFFFTIFILLSSSSPLDCKKFIHNANKLFETGNTHAMNEDYDKAIECFQLATEVNPDFTLAFKRLARIYANHRKDASKANHFFEKVFSLEPKDLETHLLKANVHKKKTEFFLLFYSTKDPTTKKLHLENKEKEQLLKTAEEILYIDPTNYDGRVYLCKALVDHGKKVEAQRHFEYLLEQWKEGMGSKTNNIVLDLLPPRVDLL